MSGVRSMGNTMQKDNLGVPRHKLENKSSEMIVEV